jgi:hypothetical protein
VGSSIARLLVPGHEEGSLLRQITALQRETSATSATTVTTLSFRERRSYVHINPTP